MPMVRAMRMLNAVEAGTLTGAQLQTLLTADPGRLAELNVLLGMQGQMRRMAASSTAMNAVAASSTAMNAVNANDQAVRIWMLAGTNQVWSNFASVAAVAASSTAMNAVAASSTAMNAVAASSTAMNAVAASSTARLAIYNSDTALNAIAGSSVAISALAASAQYQTRTAINSTSAAQSIGLTGPAIIIRLSQSWSNSAASNMEIGNLRAGTSISGVKNMGAAPAGTYNPTAGVPGNTWVLPAQATATQRNMVGNIGGVLNIGFIYV